MAVLRSPWFRSASIPYSTILRQRLHRRRRVAWLAVVAAALPLAAAALAAPAAATASDLDAEVDAAVEKVLRSTQVPSASIAVVRDGRVVLARAYGRARLDPPVPATPAMRYAVASISKQFTAAAILLLAEDGRLSLDDPVARFFPWLTRAADIRIRDLLNHTSGYRDYWPQDYVPPFMLKPIESERLMQDWAGMPLDFEPRTSWQYSNTGYVVAAAIIERVTGKTLMKFLEERIFGPLGLRSVLDVNLGRLGTEDAVGYTRFGLGPLHVAPIEGAGWFFGSGELAMTAGDLARWDVALMHGEVLSAGSMRAMTEATRLSNGASTQYGLGLGVRLQSGRRVLQHGGEASGFLSENTIFPDDDAAIVVLTNWDSGDSASRLTDRIHDILFVDRSADSARQLERARRLFAALQRGKVEAELLTDDASAYFDVRALEDCRRSLGPLGTPRSFIQTTEQLRGGLRLRVYALHFAHRDLQVLARERPDGRFEQFQVQQN